MENMSIKQRSHYLLDFALLFFIISVLAFLDKANFLLFHCLIEISGGFTGTGILLVAASTFKSFQNHFFMTMGIGYSFVGVLDVLHAISYPQIHIFDNASLNLVVQLWVAARLFELAAILSAICVIFLKKPRYSLMISSFVLAFSLIIATIFYLNTFPVCMSSVGPGLFKICMEWLYIGGLILSLLLFCKTRKAIDKNLFELLLVALVLKIISESFFAIGNPCNNEALLFFVHVIKFISFYLMYKGVIVNGILRPCEMLAYDLKRAGKNLESEIKLRFLMEDVISKNDQCIDLFINKSNDGIIIEKGQNFIFVNSTAASIFGASDILDLYNNSSISDEFKTMTLKQRERAMIEKSVMPFLEYQIISCTGELIDIECSTNYIVYSGKPALLHMFRDISHRKKIQSLENDIKNTELQLYQTNEMNRVLTEFFSNVSHELRTPLNIISSAVQLLQYNGKERPKEKTENLLNIINQNTFRLIRIINNLIDVSKYDSGFLNLNLRNYNIVSVLEDISLSVVEYANAKGLEIIFDTNVEEKLMAVDDDKIERIMLNLISNAIKFTNRGGKIIITLKDLGERVNISVKDTGIGIPDDKIGLIFQRFGQVDKSLKRNREGSGIGLSLVKTFVEMHGGSIYVNSKYKKGSEFIIDMPIKTVREESGLDYIACNRVEKIKIEFSDIYPDSLPLSS